MWGSNGFWNLALLAIGVVLAILAFTTFKGTETALNNIAGQDSRLAQQQENFGTASFEGAKVNYTDEDGDTAEFVGQEQIQDFCIDVLGS